jgi:hypothetical protein
MSSDFLVNKLQRTDFGADFNHVLLFTIRVPVYGSMELKMSRVFCLKM